MRVRTHWSPRTDVRSTPGDCHLARLARGSALGAFARAPSRGQDRAIVDIVELSLQVSWYHGAHCPHPATWWTFQEWPTSTHLKTLRERPVLVLNPILQALQCDPRPPDQKRHSYQADTLCALTEFFDLERLFLALGSSLPVSRGGS